MIKFEFNLNAPTEFQSQQLQKFRPFTEDEAMIAGEAYGVRAYNSSLCTVGSISSSGRCMYSNDPAYYHHAAVVRDFNTAFNSVTYEVYLYTYESADDAVHERGIHALSAEHLTPAHVSRWSLTTDLNYDAKLRDALWGVLTNGGLRVDYNLLSFFHEDKGTGYRLADAISEITDSVTRPNCTNERLRRIYEIDSRLEELINNRFRDSRAGGTYGVDLAIHVHTDLKVLHVYELYHRNF